MGVSVRLFIVLIFGPNTQKIHFLNFEPHTAICAVIRIDNTAQNRKLHRFATINNSNIGKKNQMFQICITVKCTSIIIYLQIIASCINLQLPIIIFKKSIFSKLRKKIVLYVALLYAY